MPKKREKLEIIYELLIAIRSSNNSIKQTPLQRAANLSTASFQEYFDELLQKELVCTAFEKKKKVIKLTEKGYLYLEEYKTIKNFLNMFDLG